MIFEAGDKFKKKNACGILCLLRAVCGSAAPAVNTMLCTDKRVIAGANVRVRLIFNGKRVIMGKTQKRGL